MTSSRPNRPLKLDDLQKPTLAEGQNPFQDDLAEEGKEADVHAPADYRGAYETDGNSNGLLLFLMSLIGLLASILPLTLYFWPVVSGMLGLFGWVISLLIAPTVLAYAVADLKSVRLGKLSSQGAWFTNCAFWIALLSMVNAAAIVVLIYVS